MWRFDFPPGERDSGQFADHAGTDGVMVTAGDERRDLLIVGHASLRQPRELRNSLQSAAPGDLGSS